MITFARKPRLGQRPFLGHPHAQGMVAFYLFNEGGGGTAFNAIRQFNGTLTNGPTWQARKSYQGYGVKFDGSNDYIDLGTPAALNFDAGQGMTVAARYKLDATPGGSESQIASRDNNTGGRAWTFDLSSSSGLRFYLNGGGGADLITESVAAAAGDDRVVAGSYRNSDRRFRLWVGGRAVVDSTATQTSVPTATTSTTIGRRNFSGAEGYINGVIDFVALWNVDVSDILPEFMNNPFAMFRRPNFATYGFAGAAAAANLWMIGQSEFPTLGYVEG